MNRKNNRTDRISKLPDFILGGILSRLPFQDAISTTILSKRWRNVLPFPVKLVLLEAVPSDQSESITLFCDDFEYFVDKWLIETFPGRTRLHHLSLRFKDKPDADKVVTWVDAAIRLGVEELILDNLYLRRTRNLLRKLDGCTTLRFLRLTVTFNKSCVVPDNFSLPNLKTLFIASVHFNDSKSVDQLVDGCPALKDLAFWGCNMKDLGILCIRSSRLKILSINRCYSGLQCDLVIDAPNLKTLLFDRGFRARNYTLSKFRYLGYANINVGESRSSGPNMEHGYGVIQIVNACSDSTGLRLSGSIIIEALREDLTVPLPEFPNLTSLELRSVGIGGWTLLARLLCNAHNLEKLLLEKVSDFEPRYTGFEPLLPTVPTGFEARYTGFESLLPTVPICLERHTKVIEFELFHGLEDEMRLVMYFLKNGKVLEKLEIHCQDFCDGMTVIQSFLYHPSHSKIHIRLGNRECRPIHYFSDFLEIDYVRFAIGESFIPGTSDRSYKFV